MMKWNTTRKMITDLLSMTSPSRSLTTSAAMLRRKLTGSITCAVADSDGYW